MLKKLSLLTAMTCLLSGCTMTWETSDFTVISPKPLDFTKHQYKVGKEVEGGSFGPIILTLGAPVRYGKPTLNDAVNNALQQEKCAVGLTNINAQLVDRHFGFGKWGWIVKGNLLLDTTKPGCNN